MLVSLSGCSILPREGPLAVEIEKQSVDRDYVVIDVDDWVVNSLVSFGPGSLNARFAGTGYSASRQVIGVGDELSITVFEADKGGLFATGQEGNRATFNSIIVDKNGQISIPYAGRIKIRGLQPFEVQDAIVRRLSDKAIQPQAIVSVVKNETNIVTVGGDINKPGVFPLSLRQRRLLDVIAEAGGTQYPARETYVRLVRNGKTGLQLLKTLIEDPRENIPVSNGDRIYLSHNPQRYTVLGAVSKPAVYKFDAPQVSVLEAVANAGGLIDLRADSTGLFLFRYESTKLLDALGTSYQDLGTGYVPTIYRINMRHAKSYFYAQSILLRDKDSLFVSNAKSVELLKLVEIFGKVTNVVSDVGNIKRNF